MFFGEVQFPLTASLVSPTLRQQIWVNSTVKGSHLALCEDGGLMDSSWPREATQSPGSENMVLSTAYMSVCFLQIQITGPEEP